MLNTKLISKIFGSLLLIEALLQRLPARRDLL